MRLLDRDLHGLARLAHDPVVLGVQPDGLHGRHVQLVAARGQLPDVLEAAEGGGDLGKEGEGHWVGDMQLTSASGIEFMRIAQVN